MSSTFTGFSEEDLKRIKSGDTNSDPPKKNSSQYKKLDKIGFKPKKVTNQYQLPAPQRLDSDDVIDNIKFDKCRLSIKTPTSQPEDEGNNNTEEKEESEFNDGDRKEFIDDDILVANGKNSDAIEESRRTSTDVAPDIIRSVDNYTEDEQGTHKVKLEELQLKQKLMEEQNKKRKEMLSKALADRTKQTEEEVMRLEKIKKELQILDGQFSQDVSVLRKKIDQACLSYSEAEKHYLRIEKEFLQAKINLQKERDKKELLTEHLCALITHNETRKAKKLETLMLELANNRKDDNNSRDAPKVDISDATTPIDDDKPVIVDGVDERTGKIVEIIE